MGAKRYSSVMNTLILRLAKNNYNYTLTIIYNQNMSMTLHNNFPVFFSFFRFTGKKYEDVFLLCCKSSIE